MSLRLHRITTVRFCLTVSTAAASLWSKVWVSLVLRGAGLAGRWETFCRHLARRIQIPSFAHISSYLETPRRLTVTAIIYHVVPGLCTQTEPRSNGIPALDNVSGRCAKLCPWGKGDADAVCTKEVWNPGKSWLLSMFRSD
jgi:hypothetical protein